MKNVILSYPFPCLGLLLALSVLSSCAERSSPTLHEARPKGSPSNTLAITILDEEQDKNKVSLFLAGIKDSDLGLIKKEARTTTFKNWENIDIRAKKVRLRVMKVLNEMDAPEELLFVPVAESGYNPYALSPTGAVGLWQLMPRTAIELGAVHRHGVDGRRHIERSTKAAVSYLQSLHNRFQSWPLALAAYNLGPWGVQRRLNKKPWQPEMGLNKLPFPAETKHYVKQILGMIALYTEGKLAFSEALQTGTLNVNAPIDLTQLERVSKLEKHEIFRLNPGLDYKNYLNRSVQIHLPHKNIALIQNALRQDPNIFKPKYIQVRVKQGDSLWKIAHRHHTSVAYLKKLNPKLKRTLSIGQPVTIPASKSFATTYHRPNPLLSHGRRIRYKVKSGDSLWKIAKKFGTSTKSIARINQISIKKLLRPGDRLWIVARFRPS